MRRGASTGPECARASRCAARLCATAHGAHRGRCHGRSAHTPYDRPWRGVRGRLERARAVWHGWRTAPCVVQAAAARAVCGGGRRCGDGVVWRGIQPGAHPLGEGYVAQRAARLTMQCTRWARPSMGSWARASLGASAPRQRTCGMRCMHSRCKCRHWSILSRCRAARTMQWRTWHFLRHLLTGSVDHEGYAYAWGCGAFGRLGSGSQRDQPAPLRVQQFARKSRQERVRRVVALSLIHI